jgi:hypothetical protein
MNNQPKIQLSPLEMELVTNSGWILTKNGVIEKVKVLFGQLQSKQDSLLSSLPYEVSQPSAKISKGEYYKGLPWLVLDHPRFFTRENVFAIRAFFWWGNFFSSTLQLSGIYKTAYQHRIMQAFPLLQQDGYFICINDDPWEHDFSAENYMQLTELSATRFEILVHDHAFIKLSKKINLHEWNNAEENLLEIFRRYISILVT